LGMIQKRATGTRLYSLAESRQIYSLFREISCE
jgi:hypothetical protein